MRASRETFLRFLADNLPGKTIHPIRFDLNNQGTELLQGNAINVSFLNPHYDVHVNEQIVVIDICHEDELTAIDWAQDIADLLFTRAYTEKYDYSVTPAVVIPNQMVNWDTSVRFREVSDDNYFRLHANLKIYFTH